MPPRLDVITAAKECVFCTIPSEFQRQTEDWLRRTYTTFRFSDAPAYNPAFRFHDDLRSSSEEKSCPAHAKNRARRCSTKTNSSWAFSLQIAPAAWRSQKFRNAGMAPGKTI